MFIYSFFFILPIKSTFSFIWSNVLDSFIKLNLKVIVTKSEKFKEQFLE
jgi:hypothetical protein